MNSRLTVDDIREMLEETGATMRYTPVELRMIAGQVVVVAAHRLGYVVDVVEPEGARAFLEPFVEVAECVKRFEEANLALADHRDQVPQPDAEDTRLNAARVMALKELQRVVAAAESNRDQHTS